jgi:hypothetical protein
MLLALAGGLLPATALAAAPSSAATLAEAEVETLLYQAVAALARKDLGHLTGLLDERAEVEVRGLNLNRHTVGRQRVRALYGPELARAQKPRVEVRSLQVRASGSRARLEASLLAYVIPEMPEGMEGLGLFQEPLPVPGRLSALLEKQGRRWVFLKMLLVFPGGAR